MKSLALRMCEGVTMSIKYAPLLGAKTLDRSLEEAESSGILNLNGRNLRNLSCCEDYDISDVTEADLSRNRFTEIPSELCACASLESLVCHHNAIKSIPDRIEQLKQLTHMDCSRNQLFSIPSSLCLLELETLILRNNRLSLLPPEVGSLKRLLELDVSNNELKLLPSSIGEMKRLRTLKLRRNQLTELPDSLCQLKLVHIDVTSNLLKSLPLSLTRLTSSLSTLEIDSNPLESPPSEVCARGLSHILRYLLRKADDQVRPQRSNSSRRARTLDRVSRRQLDTIPQASTLNSRHSVSLTAELEHAKQKIAQKHGLDLWKSPDGPLPPKSDRFLSTEATLNDGGPVTTASSKLPPVPVSVPASTTSEPEVAPAIPPREPRRNSQPDSVAANVSAISQSAIVVPTMSGSSKPSGPSSPTPRESKTKSPRGGSRSPKPDRKLAQPSSSNDKKPLSVTDKLTDKKQPSTSDKKQPTINDKNPPSNSEKKLPSSSEKKPPSSSEKKPPSSSEKKPPSSSEKKPPFSSEKKLPFSNEKKPPSSSEKKPPSNSEKKPPPVSGKKPPPLSDKKPIQHQDSSSSQRMSATQMAKSLQRKAASKSSPSRRDSPACPDKRRTSASAATDGPIENVQKEKESNGKGGLQMLKEQERIKNKQIKRMVLSKSLSAEEMEREKSRESERRVMATRIAWEDREKTSVTDQSSIPPSLSQPNLDLTLPRASGSSLKHKPSDPGPQRPVHLLKSQSTKAPRSKPTSFRGTGGKFTVKRTEQNVYDHIQRVENMRKTIETHLDMELPDDILPALSDGVVLCNFLNYVHPQTVAAVHSPASGLSLSQVKAQKNINSFLEGCKKLGVPSKMLCSPADILQHRDPNRLCQTVDCLVGLIDRETEI